jgi:hypothetical protein
MIMVDNMEEINSQTNQQEYKALEKVLKENNKYRPIYTFSFIVVFILLSIAYASLCINIGVKMNPAEVKGVEEPPAPEPIPDPPPYIPPREIRWNIEFENVQELRGSVTPTKFPTISARRTEVDFGVQFSVPGEYYNFTVDIVNKGEMDAKIYNIIQTQLTPAQSKYLKYIVTYADGTEIKVDDVLNVNDRRTVSVLVEFDEEVTKENLPSDAVSLLLEYKIVYVEK